MGKFDYVIDWYCDNCDTKLNDQVGFRAGGTWVYRVCGRRNKTSPDRILPTEWIKDDRGHDWELPIFPFDAEAVDPEDY